MKQTRKLPGLPPGSVVFTGDRKVEKIAIHYLRYDEVQITDKVLDSHMTAVFKPTQKGLIDWYDLRGIHDTRWIEALGQTFEIHPLVLEGVADENFRREIR